MGEVFTAVLNGEVVIPCGPAAPADPIDPELDRNVTLFKSPVTGKLETLKDMGMTLPQWLEAMQ